MRSSTKRRWLNLHEVSRAPAGSASSATTEVARFRIPEEFLEERVGHSCSPGLGKALPMNRRTRSSITWRIVIGVTVEGL
jgi:hypothetical protein